MAKKNLSKGLFITFEGVEGSGKTTHSKLLVEYLKRRGYACLHTREPGGTKLGEALRKTLLKSKGLRISDLSELFLFEACRSQIVKELIVPALEKNYIVICDRFSDATIAYQGYGGRVDLGVIKSLDSMATGSLAPDLTLLLDIDTLEGLRRAAKKGLDRMESKDKAYHERVRRGYLKLAKEYHRRIRIVRVRGEIEKVQALVRGEAEIVIQKFKRAG